MELDNKPTQPKDFDATIPYILYVNTLQPYKNIATLVKAFCAIKIDAKKGF